MSTASHRALLPEGLQDRLPPAALFESWIVARLSDVIHAHGYDRVDPPLIEFEETLLAGPAPVQAWDLFRLVDPVSQRTLAVRGDITGQVARIANNRLDGAERPLRLSYAGQVLRVRGTQLRHDRQAQQVGCELFAPPSPQADAEVVLIAIEALEAIGITDPTVDLTVPTLVPTIGQALALDVDVRDHIRRALDAKNAAAVQELGGKPAQLFLDLMAAAGPARRALEQLALLDLPLPAFEILDGLRRLVELVTAARPDARLTIDPCEYRAHEWHAGIGFTLFGADVRRGELGRGGRYLTGAKRDSHATATGVTLYVDSLVGAVPPPPPVPLVFLPAGTPAAEGRRLRRDGWRTLAALDAEGDPRAEARRLGCSHVCIDDSVEAVD
ncbi:ATP phosphoribosyltransferase regulatory subunit [Zavarzinia sp. CC-PAN008]|uniref:ATP phosphoribosyltransferase regulatory subunit n=1 Tax=Zavarzinia sp. CC-PAN008 TaxID=3243332 RepID=UPI003F74A514